MAQAPGYQLPTDIAEFANRYQDLLSRVIGNRMRQVGAPARQILKEYRQAEGY